MVEAISQVGKAMGIQTIAERVESAEVLAELARLGIGFAQGFHIAEPRSDPRISLPARAAAKGLSFLRTASRLAARRATSIKRGDSP